MHLRNALIRKIAGDRLVDKLDRRYNTMYTNAPRGKPVSPKVQKARSMKPIMHDDSVVYGPANLARTGSQAAGLGKDLYSAIKSQLKGLKKKTALKAKPKQVVANKTP